MGIQVKKPDMLPSKIKKEMRPSGTLRKGISDLIAKRGSYLIVSSGASTSDSSLSNRKAAMQSAIDKEDKNGRINCDFLDRGRVATWVRSHPALILWTKNRIGHSFVGWRSFGNWAWLSPATSNSPARCSQASKQRPIRSRCFCRKPSERNARGRSISARMAACASSRPSAMA